MGDRKLFFSVFALLLIAIGGIIVNTDLINSDVADDECEGNWGYFVAHMNPNYYLSPNYDLWCYGENCCHDGYYYGACFNVDNPNQYNFCVYPSQSGTEGNIGDLYDEVYCSGNDLTYDYYGDGDIDRVIECDNSQDVGSQIFCETDDWENNPCFKCGTSSTSAGGAICKGWAVGETRYCYENPSTPNYPRVGACVGATETYQGNGAWSACSYNPNTHPEIADNNVDEDCDGFKAPGFVGSSETCIITTNNYCASEGYYSLMGLSSYTDALTTRPDSITTSNSPYVLCCNFGDGIQPGECNDAPKLLGLSASTGAYVQNATYTNYPNSVCYDNSIPNPINCITSTGTQSEVSSVYQSYIQAAVIGSGTDFGAILGLSAATGARVGIPGDYSLKLWCDIGSVCGNGVLEDGEVCDSDVVTTCSGSADTCSSFNQDDVGCNAQAGCYWDQQQCVGIAKQCTDDDLVLDETACNTQAGCSWGSNDALCTTSGGYEGYTTLSCDTQCSGYDEGSCTAVERCGDGILNGGEECDGVSNCAPVGSVNQCTCETGYDSSPSGLCIYEGAAVDTNYWSEIYENAIMQPATTTNTIVNVNAGTTTAYMGVVAYSSLSGASVGEVVEFEIYEKDIGSNTIRGSSERIQGVIVSTNPQVLAVGNWTITQTDLDRTSDYDHFYFKAFYNGNEIEDQSGFLSLTQVNSLLCAAVSTCMDYSTQETCENDYGLCRVGSYSVQLNNPDVDCNDPTIDCSCWWDTETTSCSSQWSDALTGGTCAYTETTDDDCGDGFLAYIYTAIWSLTGGENIEVGCTSGENIIPCPAKVQLNFFTALNVIGVIVILVLIYWAINSKKFRKSSKKVVKKKRK